MSEILRTAASRLGICGLLCVALLGLVPVALAAEAANLGSISISAPAPEIRPDPTAGRSELNAEEIEASGASTVAEVLAAVPGVTATTAGAPGAIATMSIRGSTSSQVLVIVDGAPATDPATGLTDFSRLGLQPADIASVQVIRGGASAQYGADAVGGVILIKTKRSEGRAKPVLELRVSNLLRQPFGWVEGSGLSAQTMNPDLLSLVDGQDIAVKVGLPGGFEFSAGGERSANEYLYIDANGMRRRRENAGLLSGNFGASWKGEAGTGSLDASAEGFIRELGVPGPSEAPSPEASERDAQLRASIRYATDSFLTERLALESSAFGLLSQTSYRQTRADAEDANLASRGGLDARASLLVTEAVNVGFGLSSRYDRLDSSNVKAAGGGVPQRVSIGVYAEPSLAVAGWTLTPAARIDWTSDFPSGFSASLGAARKLLPALTMSANASTAYRAPSFNDLYWPAAAGAEGNPGLKPETAMGGDLGFDYGDEGMTLSGSAYLRYTKDVILWQPGTDSIWRPSNFGAALYPGFELAGNWKGGGPVSTHLSYTFLHSYVLSGGLGFLDDHRVPMVPEHAFELGFEYAKSPYGARAALAWKGLRYLGVANVAYDPAHLVVDAHLSYEAGRASSLELDAENLLDERYESVKGYPMPGFTLRLTLKTRLGGKP